MLRLTAAALAVCRAAAAEPASPPVAPAAAALAAPGRWRPLPALATAMTTAAKADGRDGVAVDAADAWGEPAMGCYAVRLALRGPAGPADGAAAITGQVLAGVAALSPRDVVRPSAPDGVLGFAFARPPYRGRARVRIAAGRIAAVACFASDREPAACDAACAGVLEHLP